MDKSLGKALHRDQEDVNRYEFNVRFKRKMNRIFREHVGLIDRIPHPEVDNTYERFRSTLVYYVRKFLRL